MKTAPTGLKAWLDSCTGDAKCWMCDLITLTLLDGVTVYRWTTSDTDIVWGGNTYYSGGGGNAPLVTRGPYKQSSKLTIDTCDIMLGGPFSLISRSLARLAIDGYFDGSRIQVDHCIEPTPGVLTYDPISKWFEGPVTDIEPDGVNVRLRCKSQFALLNIQLPKYIITSQCQNTLYDSGCTLDRADFTFGGVCMSSTDTTVLTASTPIANKPMDNFSLGVLKFTNGWLEGINYSIESAALVGGVVTFTMARPMAQAAGAGQTFTVTYGCGQSSAICAARFSNGTNFRGCEYIPSPESGST